MAALVSLCTPFLPFLSSQRSSERLMGLLRGMERDGGREGVENCSSSHSES